MQERNRMKVGRDRPSLGDIAFPTCTGRKHRPQRQPCRDLVMGRKGAPKSWFLVLLEA